MSVEALRLDANRLTGTLPPELSSMTNLVSGVTGLKLLPNPHPISTRGAQISGSDLCTPYTSRTGIREITPALGWPPGMPQRTPRPRPALARKHEYLDPCKNGGLSKLRPKGRGVFQAARPPD